MVWLALPRITARTRYATVPRSLQADSSICGYLQLHCRLSILYTRVIEQHGAGGRRTTCDRAIINLESVSCPSMIARLSLPKVGRTPGDSLTIAQLFSCRLVLRLHLLRQKPIRHELAAAAEDQEERER